jgi:hypothetical protein
MTSPVPRHLRTEDETEPLRRRGLYDHVIGLAVNASNGVAVPGATQHRAKYAPGLSTALMKLANTESVGDPMCGTGMLAWETGARVAFNDIDEGMARFLSPLSDRLGCHVTYRHAGEIRWKRDVCVFSPPYYPRTDRRRPNAHDDAKRGPVVGFRDSYNADHPKFIGNPGGADAVLTYRNQMTGVYRHLTSVCDRMIVVTKNWTRLGVELRLDLDTILMAESVGWECYERTGFTPRASLWSTFNRNRGIEQGRIGSVAVEDVMLFRKPTRRSA